MTSRSQVDYSIIIPVYFNEGALTNTLAALTDEVIAKHPERSCEVIFVDDGSRDGSFEELMRLRAAAPRLIRVIKFTRNFGQVNALMAGFELARGKCVVAMSADGQDPPGLINDLLKGHFDDGYEVVVCTRQGRDESYYRVVTSKLFYAAMRWLTFPNMPPGGFDFVLLGRRAVTVLLENRDSHLFLQGQILWMGFTTKFIAYERRKRQIGTSRWTFGRKLTYLIDGILSYSYFPIRFISCTGIVFALIGFIYAAVVVLNKVLLGNAVKGWTPLMVVVLVIGGLQMMMLGVIGEYLWRTLSQVRKRSDYIIDAVYEDAGENA